MAHTRGNPREPDASAPDPAATAAATATHHYAATTTTATTAATAATATAAAATATAAATAAARGHRLIGAGCHDNAGDRKRAEHVGNKQRSGGQNACQIFSKRLHSDRPPSSLRQWKLAGADLPNTP